MSNSGVRRVLSALLVVLCGAACAPLQTLADDTCGNGVVEPELGEDCEPFEGSAFRCRPPGESPACTIECDASNGCPTGYGCGTDDVCRRPGGTFEAFPFVQAGSKADELLTGDFDADRRGDVVAVEPGRARIYFTDASGNVDQATVTSALPPAIGKLGPLVGAATTLDTTDDLVLPLSFGIGALLSEGNRSFKSKAYGSVPLDTLVFEIPGLGEEVAFEIRSVVPMVIDAVPAAMPPFSGDETAALLELRYDDPFDGSDEKQEITVFSDFGSTSGGMIFPLDEARLESLSGPLVRGNFDDDPCEELVVPRAGWKLLRVYKLCEPLPFVQDGYRWTTWGAERDAMVAEIDLGGKAAGPVFARDVDGDEHLDLAAVVLAGGVLQLRVAYGVGGGKFHSTRPPLLGQAPDGKAGPYADLPSGSPLALEYLDGDVHIDMVDTGGIARGTEAGFVPWYPGPRPWTDTAITDINGDGRLDVLASSDGATDIDVLLGTPEGVWNASQISTGGTVSQLVAGDFDGDLVQDVVYDDLLSGVESRISISYGRTYGGPEEAREVGSFGAVERLLAGNIHTFGADAIDELGVISVTEGSRAFSFFPGTATRLLQAPLLLNDASQVTHLPLAAGSGFLPEAVGVPQTEGRRDVLVLAADPDPDVKTEEGDSLAGYKTLASTLRVWALFGSEGEAEIELEESSICAIPGGFYFPRLEPAHSIAVSSTEPSSSGLVFAAAPFMTFTGETAGDVQISSVIGAVSFEDPAACWPWGAEYGRVFVSAPGELMFRLRTADLNVNGIPEVLAIKKTYDPAELKTFLDTSLVDTATNMPGGGPMGSSPLTVLRSELVVLWDADMLNVYSLPQGSVDARDFTVGEIDGDGDPDLLVLDGPRLRRFEGHNGTQELTAEQDITDVPIPGAGAQAILLVDVDGDGIQDVAVRSESLQIFRGAPAIREASRE